jgi:hypothetical protein
MNSPHARYNYGSTGMHADFRGKACSDESTDPRIPHTTNKIPFFLIGMNHSFFLISERKPTGTEESRTGDGSGWGWMKKRLES